jgi:hypothetical protein
MLTDKVVHGVLMDNVVAIHRSLTKLESPRWPEDLLGRIDLDRPAKAKPSIARTAPGAIV